jgi:hypothetical protein
MDKIIPSWFFAPLRRGFSLVKAGAPWRGLPEAPHTRNPCACELPHVGGMPATVLFVCPCLLFNLDETMGT